MAKKPKGATFAELIRQPTWSERDAAEPARHGVRPGQYNTAGELFDLNGLALVRIRQDLTPRQAQALLAEGALVAHESCGCGGWTRCQPDWLSNDALSRLRATAEPPQLAGRDAPTWIDLWSSDTGPVIYLHGDVRWGGELS